MTGDSGRSVDMMTLATSKSNRFGIRYSLLLLGLIWFTAGSTLATNLIVTNEPPKFPLCENGQPVVPPGVSPLASCDVPVEAALACDTVYSRYINRGNSVVSQFGLLPSHCPSSKPDVMIVQCLVLISMGLAALLIVPLGDKIGRKPLIQLGSWTFFCSQVLASFAPAIVVYFFATVVGAASLVTMLVPICVTAAELIPTGSRHYLALTQVVGFALGGAFTAGSSYVLQSWRSLTLLTALPMLVFLGGCVWLSGLLVESPKWLASRGRMEEAYEIWTIIAQYNNLDRRELISLDEFIKSEVESTRATIISTPEELDEELSIMSVQYLAAPDSVIKACSNFPTSIWLGCLACAWVASGTVYSGLWHTRYSPLIDELLKSSDLNQSANPINPGAMAMAGAPARLLQAVAVPVAPSNLNQLPLARPTAAVVYRRPAGADLVTAAALHIPQDQQAQIIAQPYAGAQMTFAPLVPYNTLVATALTQVGANADIPPVNVAAAAADIPIAPNPREYLDFINSYLKDGGNYIIDRAKAIPQRAQEMYDDYEMDKMLEDMRRDFDFYSDQARNKSLALENFQNKSRVLLLFTTMTYILDLPCALLVIFLSGRQWCGRKGAILSYSFSSGCMILGAGLLSFSQNLKTILPVSMAVAGRSMLSAVYQMLFVYTSECVPTSVRCGCVGIMLSLSCITAGCSLPLSDLIDTRLKEGTLFFIGAAAVAASFLGTTILPDTLGLPLCDTLEIQEVMYENLGYHDLFFKRKLHRVAAFLYQKLCCFNLCFGKSAAKRTRLNNTLEAKGRSWLKNKINNKSRKHLFELMSPSNVRNNRNDENISTADTNC